jgi:hypothetical protein
LSVETLLAAKDLIPEICWIDDLASQFSTTTGLRIAEICAKPQAAAVTVW